MNMRMLQPRRGMTLVELLVVIAIVGLLAVAVGPLFQGRSDRRKFEAAAGVVSAHFNDAIARSIGSAAGGGVWLPADGGPLAGVSTLGFTKPRANVTGNVTIPTPPTGTTATVTLSAVPSPAAGLLHVAGYPVPFELINGTTIGFLSGYTIDNCAFPPVGSTHKFRAAVPPRQRITAGTRLLAGGYCIDLSASTIGVHGYTTSTGVVPLSSVQSLAVTFDATGRATMAWWTTDNVNWTWEPLDAARPIALLVGASFRVGLPITSNPTIDDPGPNIQSRDAKWIIIDPRSAMVRTIDNQLVSDSSLTPVAAVTSAQAYVRQHLLNQ